MKYFICCIAFLLAYTYSFAQETNPVNEPATGLRADGKIYVVVAVVVTILLGLIIYVVNLDRKITKLEKHSRDIA